MADRPPPVAQQPAAPVAWPPTSGGLFRRIGSLRHTSPGRLQLMLAALLTLALLTGLVAGVAATSAAAATADLGDRAQPLLVEAETIYSALADADTTAAQAFLAGGLEPAALTRRYDADIDRATAALTAAARRAPATGAAADAIRALSTGVARYTGLVATARAVNRQGLPVGASYLAAASALNRDVLLPKAQALFQTAKNEVDDGYHDASGAGWLLLYGVLLAALLAALVLTQAHLSRRTNRTFNVPLLAATGLTVLLALGSLIVLSNQSMHLNLAGDTGSQPVVELAETRILALRERGDEALTLAARGSGSKHEEDFQAARAAIEPALSSRYLSDEARAGHRAYLAAHDRVRKLDDGGDYEGAVKLAVSDATGAEFGRVTAAVDTALEGRKAAFTDQIGKAGTGLGLLSFLAPLLGLAVCLLAAAGIRARLEEYRR